MSVSFDSDPDENLAAGPGQCITIGLINNMPDEALKATERQFAALLHAASGGMPVRLSFYSLPGIPRTAAMQKHMRSHYTNIDRLWAGQLDGLIVTGREPLATRLEDEPYWPAFTRLLAWARENTHSTIWSCLAAHAAVLHMDGIERVKRNEKLFGVFDCEHSSHHPLLAQTPPAVRLPHSRWNGIPEDRLIATDYQVLTSGAEVGVDTFIKQKENLFVFFQGHPEYAADTLLREYRRDVGRFFRGEADQYPLLPCNYFEESTSSTLAALRAEALATRHQHLLADVAAELEKTVIRNTWTPGATTIYRNWLEYLCTRKQTGLLPKLSPDHRMDDSWALESA